MLPFYPFIKDHTFIIRNLCYKPYVYNKIFCAIDYLSIIVGRLHGLPMHGQVYAGKLWKTFKVVSRMLWCLVSAYIIIPEAQTLHVRILEGEGEVKCLYNVCF